MKKSILTIVVIIILTVIALTLYAFAAVIKSSPQQSTIPPTQIAATPTNTGSVLCEPNELSGSITLDHAAGNVYGSLMLTNISSMPCNVVLGQSVTTTYKAKNIAIHYQPAPTPGELTLQPNEKVYSQAHFPNGPQCQGPTTEQPVTFLYEVDGKTVPFKLTTNEESVTIQACSGTEITRIDLWPLSKKPIVQ